MSRRPGPMTTLTEEVSQWHSFSGLAKIRDLLIKSRRSTPIDVNQMWVPHETQQLYPLPPHCSDLGVDLDCGGVSDTGFCGDKSWHWECEYRARSVDFLPLSDCVWADFYLVVRAPEA